LSVLVSCQNLSKTFGTGPLFEGLDFTLTEGERVGVVGPNGAGKSTLAKIIAGLESTDSGIVSRRTGLKLCYVAQDSQFPPKKTIQNALVDALIKDRVDGHDAEDRVRSAIWDAGFSDPDALCSSLSGGWTKRLAIVEQLVREPDVLILDEPTNHLDIEGILWLEDKLKRGGFTSIFVTHDRYILHDVASRIVEVNKLFQKGTFSVAGDYAEFLQRKAHYIAAQTKEADAMANRLRREEDWLRHGPKARTTKSTARIDEAYRLKADLAESLNRLRSSGSVGLDFTGTGRKTKKLVEVVGLKKEYEGRKLFAGFDLTITAGMKLGVLGPNGSGKSTLLKVIMGEVKSDEGKVVLAERIRISYFDQLRQNIDTEITLKDALAPHGDSVVFSGRSIHVATWAKRFLFRPDQLHVRVGRLSGGERARLLLARHMLIPADVLLLDEPTNDLDIPTLEILEEAIADFDGAVILVSHDRYLVDRVTTHLLGLDGKGNFTYFADFSQWNKAQKGVSPAALRAGSGHTKDVSVADSGSSDRKSNKKLSYKEQRELDGMEQAIAVAEADVERCKEELADPKIALHSAKLAELSTALSNAESKIEKLYTRWAELEAKIR
jgi:ATP-binding cassette subfamily F protein uup